MKTEALLKDPVIQLNLLLWMAKEQPPEGYRVRPLFCELGFRLMYIEQPFAFPVEAVRAIGSSGLDIAIKPEPDLILGRQLDATALYFEAKSGSFALASTDCRQARGHLVASGPAFGEVYAPLSRCLLCYVVPEGERQGMADCLTALRTELGSCGLNPGPFSCHGLAVAGSQVIYCWDSAFKTHVGAADDSATILNEVSEETDPAPLLLVFTDEDCPNPDIREFYRRALVEQVRVCLLCGLHPLPIGATYSATPDGLLMKTTEGVFQYLGRKRQKSLCRLIRQNVLKRTHEYWAERQSDIGFDGNSLSVTWGTPGDKEDFLDWLEDRRTTFDASRPTEEQRTLFDPQDETSSGKG